MKKIIILIIISNTVLISCFIKQKHEVTAPEVPQYTLSGTTIDYVTGEAVPNTSVYIKGVAMVYGNRFPSQTVQSDNEGHYVIDPVYPGNYIIQIVKDDCLLNEKKLEIQDEDRELDLAVTDIIYAKKFPSRIPYNDISVFVHANNLHPYFSLYNTAGLFPAELWKDKVFTGYYFCSAKFAKNQWTWESFVKLDFNPDDLGQLEMGVDYYYAIKYPDTLLVFEKNNLTISNTITTGITYKDIAYNLSDNTFYICTDSLLYQMDVNSGILTEIAPLPETGNTAMTWHENKLYVYNKQENLLFYINFRLQIEKAYAVVNESNKVLLEDIYDLHFDYYNNLWLTTL